MLRWCVSVSYMASCRCQQYISAMDIWGGGGGSRIGKGGKCETCSVILVFSQNLVAICPTYVARV